MCRPVSTRDAGHITRAFDLPFPARVTPEDRLALDMGPTEDRALTYATLVLEFRGLSTSGCRGIVIRALVAS